MSNTIYRQSFSNNGRKAYEITIDVEETHFYEASVQHYANIPTQAIEAPQAQISAKNKYLTYLPIQPREVSKIIATNPKEMPLALFYLTNMISREDKIHAMNFLLSAHADVENTIFQTYLNTPLPTHILGYRTIHQLREASNAETKAVIQATGLLMNKEIEITPQSLSWVIGEDLRNEYDGLIAAVTQAYAVLWRHNDLFSQFYAKAVTSLLPSLTLPGTLGIAENGELVSQPT